MEENFICYTCDKKLDVYSSEAGHFKHGRLDFDRQNIHCQCVRCNKYLHGHLGEYANRLIKQYGLGIIDELTLRANQHKGYKVPELEEIYNNFGEYGRVNEKS